MSLKCLFVSVEQTELQEGSLCWESRDAYGMSGLGSNPNGLKAYIEDYGEIQIRELSTKGT